MKTKLLSIIILLLLTSSAYAGHYCHKKGIGASPSVNVKSTCKAINSNRIGVTAIGGNASASTAPVSTAADAATGPVSVQTPREYPAPVQPQYGPTTTSTSWEIGPNFGFTPLEDALAGRRWFNREALESLAKGVKMTGGYKRINKSVIESSTEDWIHLVIMEHPELYPGINEPRSERSADITGIVEAQATKYGNTLTGLFAKTALQALDDGCNFIIVYLQGYNNWDKTSGGGIGMAYVKAGDSSNGAGGTGFAWAEAGKYSRAIIGAVCGVDSRFGNPR